MVKIQIDGKIYEAEAGKNLLHTCIALGFDVPYFCYHPALGSVGACRQCAVKRYKNADDKTGRIVMSCMEPVAEGLIISINDPDVKAFRASVIESLMTNHPHDCPVCDEGGECHLQDMTLLTGHNYRRFDFKKRTYHNQDLGPYITHEMNRCIQCYRCVRFYRDYAGGKDLHVFGSANHVYFGRHNDGAFESIFSGNLVEVCPTGVFTDKTLHKHFTRKWDLTNSPSVCTRCSVGCNIIVSERYGTVRRIMSRYNANVNGYFICDRGRFGYEFINSPDRIKNILVKSKFPEPDQKSETQLSAELAGAVTGKRMIGIGSPEASLESNYALELLVGMENFYQGISDEEYVLTKTAIEILEKGIAHSPSLKEIEKSDAILILGEDPGVTAPMLALSVLQATRNKTFEIAASKGISLWNDAAVRDLAQNLRSPLFIVAPSETILDEFAVKRFAGSWDEMAILGYAVASAISTSAPAPKKIDGSVKDAASLIAGSLMNARNPLIITGLQSKNIKILQAAANIVLALSNNGKKPSLSIIFPECNSLGLGLLGGKPLGDLVKNDPDSGNIETLVILENDLYKRVGKDLAETIMNRGKKIIALNHSSNETTSTADIVLPAGTFSESTGTIVNNEGRAQRYYRVLPDDGIIKDSWKHLLELAGITGVNNNQNPSDYDGIVKSLTDAYPVFAKIRNIMPDSEFRIFNEKIPRQTPRFSGRTAISANVTVHEPKPPQDNDSPLKFSMEGYKGVPPQELVTYYWSPGWNSPQAINKYLDEPGGRQEDGNPGVLLFEEKPETAKDYFDINDIKQK